MSNSIPPLPQLQDWKKGDKFLASHLQQPIAALKSILQSMAAAGADVDFAGREMRVGVIVDKGPNGESAYADERYWVQFNTVNGDTPTATLIFTEDKSDQLLDSALSTSPGNPVKTPNIVLASNLPEWLPSSHMLPTGTPVTIFAWWDAGSPGGQGSGGDASAPVTSNKRWMMWEAPVAYVMFRVALTQDGGSNGSLTTAASYTYTAKTADSSATTLGTTLSPERPRENGTYTAATKGSGYFDENGDFQLYEALEKPGTAGCS